MSPTALIHSMRELNQVPPGITGKRIRTVRGMVDWRLCLGCGACAYICPERKISLVDAMDEGTRPIVGNEDCRDCRLCLEVCPAFENDHRKLLRRSAIDASVAAYFGPVLEVWEGYARDPEIRNMGSSGGALTALALYCLEREQMHGVLHLGGDPHHPVSNRTCFSQTREALLATTGSRYAPGSVCDGLGAIASAPRPCAFIGQPSEVTALRKILMVKPEMNDSIGLVMSFFCAGSPSTQGTEELLRSCSIDVGGIEELRYRGIGWPGMFAVRMKGEPEFRDLKSYQDAWGALQRFRPYSVHLFPDSSGEDADISCGDAWNRPSGEISDGYSIVVVRTERGRRALREAMAAGYLHLERVDSARLLEAQKSLLRKRGAIRGRILAFRLAGLPVPRLNGFSLDSAWKHLSLKEKLKATVGTLRRIIQRKYYRPYHIEHYGTRN